MNTKNWILLVMICSGFLWSGSFKQPDPATYREAASLDVFMVHSSATFEGYYYLGSNETGHFFVAKWKWQRDDRFRIKKSILEVIEEKPFGTVEIRLPGFGPQRREGDTILTNKISGPSALKIHQMIL